MNKDIEVSKPTNDFQEADLIGWLSNKTINTKADGPLNPILWKKNLRIRFEVELRSASRMKYLKN